MLLEEVLYLLVLCQDHNLHHHVGLLQARQTPKTNNKTKLEGYYNVKLKIVPRFEIIFVTPLPPPPPRLSID